MGKTHKDLDLGSRAELYIQEQLRRATSNNYKVEGSVYIVT